MFSPLPPHQVRSAYRQLALLHHPDKTDDPASLEAFQSIAKAHEALTDPRAASNYRKYGHPDGPQGLRFGLASLLLDERILLPSLLLLVAVPLLLWWFTGDKGAAEAKKISKRGQQVGQSPPECPRLTPPNFSFFLASFTFKHSLIGLPFRIPFHPRQLALCHTSGQFPSFTGSFPLITHLPISPPSPSLVTWLSIPFPSSGLPKRRAQPRARQFLCTRDLPAALPRRECGRCVPPRHQLAQAATHLRHRILSPPIDGSEQSPSTGGCKGIQPLPNCNVFYRSSPSCGGGGIFGRRGNFCASPKVGTCAHERGQGGQGRAGESKQGSQDRKQKTAEGNAAGGW